jgi:hypothetical protein
MAIGDVFRGFIMPTIAAVASRIFLCFSHSPELLIESPYL